MPETRTQFIQKLVDLCLAMLSDLTGMSLYSYQDEVADRIFFSLLYGDAEEITVETARQVGKSETLADVSATAMIIFPKLAAAFPDDPVIKKFRLGIMIGCFAPIDQQAETIFSRIEDRLTSEQARLFLTSPDINETVRTGAELIKVSNGSFCRRQTAHPKSKIESKTYHLIIMDEAQDCDSETVRRRIHPMMAAVGGTIMKIGTPAAVKGDFYEAIRRNVVRSNTNGKKNHFSYDWKRAAKENPYYAQAIKKEMARLGEDSDEFLLAYCVAPDVRLLTSDLKFVPAGEIKEGMSLAGFDEERPGFGMHRGIKKSIVQRVGRITRPCYTITLSDGRSITCSAEHRWLVSTAGRRTLWKTTKDLTSYDRIFKIVDPWEEKRTYKRGYLAAAFDGEGCLSTNANRRPQLTFSQLENVMMAKVREYLDDLGYRWSEFKNTTSGVGRINICGRANIMRFLGEIRPYRLLEKFDIDWVGSIGRHDHRDSNFEHPRVVGLKYVGKQEVMAIKTSTKTYIAEGLASHNCCKWLLERGMFVTEELMEELGDKQMEMVPYYSDTPVVIGIDVAQTHDSTVATAMWVDWDHPDEFGLFRHVVLAWLELHGENWESQYRALTDFVSNYWVMRVCVDAQGMGGPVAERLQVLLPSIEVEALEMDLVKQSERWKHLTQLLQRRLVRWPAGRNTRRLLSYRRFTQQLSDVEKTYKGKYLLVGAPKQHTKMHDDYIDSLALACWATKEFGQENVVEVLNSNPLMERGGSRR